LRLEEPELLVPRHLDPGALAEEHLRAVRHTGHVHAEALLLEVDRLGARDLDDLAEERLLRALLGAGREIEPALRPPVVVDHLHEDARPERHDVPDDAAHAGGLLHHPPAHASRPQRAAAPPGQTFSAGGIGAASPYASRSTSIGWAGVTPSSSV